jgi:2-phosphosulfolactate phosphatase
LDFDLGNSPREMTAEIVSGKRLATTTTNGTRALHACRGAEQVWLGSFLNLSTLGQAIREADPQRLLLVCAGTGEAAALEDSLGAGALCDLLWPTLGQAASDSARLVCHRYRNCQSQLLQVAIEAKNARHLLSIPSLAEDVAFCVQRDAYPIVGKMNADGWVTV